MNIDDITDVPEERPNGTLWVCKECDVVKFLPAGRYYDPHCSMHEYDIGNGYGMSTRYVEMRLLKLTVDGKDVMIEVANEASDV